MATKRKLVTIRRITNVRRLQGKHRGYDVITVGGGWTVVVFHKSFDLGDLVIYFEIDSFIPSINGRFSWEKYDTLTTFQGQRGYHVASQMLGKQLSQGLAQHIEALPEVKQIFDELKAEHGQDTGIQKAMEMSFEDVLGVRKWEIPFESQGLDLGRVPEFFPRPSCERAQNIEDLFSFKNQNTMFQVTEKVDGVSMSVYRVATNSKWHKALPDIPEGSKQETSSSRVGVSSAGKDLDERSNNVYWQAAKRLGLPAKLDQIGLDNVAVQGELIGPTVKNNSLNFGESSEHEFIVFQIFDIDQQAYLASDRVVTICEQLGFPHVPVFGYYTLKSCAGSLEELLAKAEGISMRRTTREGLIFKSMDPRKEFAFKVISNKWLLEQGE